MSAGDGAHNDARHCDGEETGCPQSGPLAPSCRVHLVYGTTAQLPLATAPAPAAAPRPREQLHDPVLAEREQVIDALYLEVEGLAAGAILLLAPVASDLRFLLSVLRVVPELERSHDLVMQIASRAGRVRGEDLSPRGRGLVERTGELASGMWRLAAAPECNGAGRLVVSSWQS